MTNKDTKYSARRWVLFGFFFTIVFISGFVGWAHYTFISGAVVVSGSVRGSVKSVTIQDSTAGKISELSIEEGDEVYKNDALLIFDKEELTTEYIIVKDQLFELLARRGRLEAERDNREEIYFDELIKTDLSQKTVDQKTEQKLLFQARRTLKNQQIEQLKSKIHQSNDLVQGLQEQKTSLKNEINLVQGLLENKRTLLDQGLARTGQVVELQREALQLQSRNASLSTEISQTESSKTEIEIEILKQKTQAQENALVELRDQQFKEMELRERFTQLREKIEDKTIIAPISGTIFSLNFHSEGAVVRPAEDILTIVPVDSSFEIVAQVQPVDIDEIYWQQDARIMFPSVNRNDQQDLYGKVKNISADTFTDQRSGLPYFEVKVTLPASELEKLPEDFTIRSGMIVEVFILKGDRTVMNYLTAPLTGFFTNAFRE